MSAYRAGVTTSLATIGLRPVDVRVLGCLVEKHLTTPDTYPLTLNALVTACNQTSNRWPVTSYRPAEINDAIDALRTIWRLVRVLHAGAGSRTDKYRHVLDDAWGLSRPEAAVLSVLALRGPQTLGELKTRTERQHPFASLAEVDAVIDRLADPSLRAEPSEPALARETGMLRVPSSGEARETLARPWPAALALRLERGPGQKEGRVTHLLGDCGVDGSAEAGSGPGGSGSSGSGSGSSLVGGLVAEVEALRGEIVEMRADFDRMRLSLEDLRRQLGEL